ncbi:MAG: ROK family transcriptional regulator [Actinomycetaceae bacterium]|nr:ROK family transcriptional regulator [Actinomycetaceae bacterium]
MERRTTSPALPSRAPVALGERSRTGMRIQSLRAMNLSLVLRDILAFPGVATRASISQRTGITPATVSRLVDSLIDSGLVTALPPIVEPTRGRPATPLIPTQGRAIALGLEVNVSGLDVRLVDLAGDILAEETVDMDLAGSDPQITMTHLARLARQVLHNGRNADSLFIGSGLAIPGLISDHTLTLAPNLGWRDIPIAELTAPLQELAPVVIRNEADLAAVAVSHPRPGVPDGPPSFVYVSGEVGVGAGIVINHVPLTGANGWSGEIGHVCVDPQGPQCSCGAQGCLEAILGRRALVQRAGLDMSASSGDIMRAAENGSEAARAALHEGGVALGRALSSVINLVDIPLVLLGGHIAELTDYIAPIALKEMRSRILQAPWSDLQIESIPDSTWLAVNGATHEVLQALVDDPLAWMDE